MNNCFALITPTCEEFAGRYISAARQTGLRAVVVATRGSDIKPETFPLDTVIYIDELSHTPSQLIPVLSGIEGLIGIVAASEFSVEAADYLSSNLGLLRSMDAPADTLRNKVAMRLAFNIEKVEQPVLIGSAGTLSEAASLCDCIEQYPVILKPVDMAGSWHVSLCYDKASILDRCTAIFNYRKSYATGIPFAGRCLVETFVEGKEYSAEVVVRDGEICQLFITRKFISALPFFDEIGHLSGAIVAPDLEARIRANIRSIISSAKVRNSVIHVEFKITASSTIGIIEVGCRVPGDMITDLVELTYGVSLEEQMLRAKAGIELSLIRKESSTPHSIQFLFSAEDIENARCDPKLVQLCLYSEKSSLDKDSLSPCHLTRRLGYAIRMEDPSALSEFVRSQGAN